MSQTKTDRFPREVLKSRGVADLALVFGLAILLFLGVEAGIRRYLASSPSSISSWLFDGKWNMLLTMKEGADWVILGDSSASFGIDRDLFHATTGQTAVNLATVAESLTVNDAWMLQTYIERFGPPKHVLLMRSARQWGLPINEILATSVPLEYGYWERLEPNVPFDTHAQWLYLVNRYAPFYKAPRTVRQLLEPPWQGIPSAAQIQDGGFLRFHERRPAQLIDSVAQLRQHLETTGLGVSPASHAGLAALAKSAKRYGFHIYIALPPVCRAIYRNPRFRMEHRRLATQLEALAARSPHLHLLEKEPMLFPVTDMQNADHLIASAATRYTAALVSRLRQEAQKR